MKHIKKFNEEIYFRGGTPINKFYWLKDKRGGGYTIGEYDGNAIPGFWTIIGTDEEYSDEHIRKYFVKISEIPFTP